MKYKMDHWLEGLWGKIQANTSVLTATATNRSKSFPVLKMNVTLTDTNSVRYGDIVDPQHRPEEHTSELQYLLLSSYDVSDCKKNQSQLNITHIPSSPKDNLINT